MRNLNKDFDREDTEGRDIEKKRIAARKLIKEKEKAIEEGLKAKLRGIEG